MDVLQGRDRAGRLPNARHRCKGNTDQWARLPDATHRDNLRRTSNFSGIPMPKSARFLPLLGVALLALAACSEAPDSDAGDTTAQAPASDAGAGADSGSTAQLDYSLPPEDFAADPEAGRSLFRANCMQCHGEDARGTDQGPPLIHRIYEPSHHPDITFHRAVALGVHQHHWDFGDMPPVAGVSGEDTAHIIAWIRQEQRAVGID